MRTRRGAAGRQARWLVRLDCLWPLRLPPRIHRTCTAAFADGSIRGLASDGARLAGLPSVGAGTLSQPVRGPKALSGAYTASRSATPPTSHCQRRRVMDLSLPRNAAGSAPRMLEGGHHERLRPRAVGPGPAVSRDACTRTARGYESIPRSNCRPRSRRDPFARRRATSQRSHHDDDPTRNRARQSSPTSAARIG